MTSLSDKIIEDLGPSKVMKGKVEYDPDHKFAYVSFETSELIRRLEASLKTRVGGRFYEKRDRIGN